MLGIPCSALRTYRVRNAMGPHSHEDMVLCLPGSSHRPPQVSEMKVIPSPMPDKCPKERGDLHITCTYPSLTSTHSSGVRGWHGGGGGGEVPSLTRLAVSDLTPQN